MHRALGIPEVLDIIFQFTAASTDARCARVHKAWQEAALDSLWYRVDDPGAFLRAVSPTSAFERRDRLVSTSVTLESWDRFLGYAKRVRSVCLDGHSTAAQSQSMAIIGTFGQPGNIFPNLRHLSINCESIRDKFTLAQLFLQASLRTISITILGVIARFDDDTDSDDEDEEAITCKLLPFIARRSSHIICLIIKDSGSFLARHPTPLVELLLSLPKLRVVDIPSAAVTSHLPLIHALVACPNLQVLSAECGTASRMPLSPPPLKDAIFSNLTELSLADSFGSIAQVLQSSFPASRLRKLHATHRKTEPEDGFPQFLQAVGQLCATLEDLAIIRTPTRSANILRFGSPDMEAEAEPGFLTLGLLAPLKNCRRLIHFRLKTSVALEVVRKDLKSLISSWTLLRTCTFIFSEDKKSKGFNAGDVIEFARRCPHLEEPSLVVDFSKKPAANNHTFQCLRRLYLSSYAKVHDITDSAMFLVQLTSRYCKITSLSDVSPPEVPHRVARQSRNAAGIVDPGVVDPQSLASVVSVIPSMRAIHSRYQDELRKRDYADRNPATKTCSSSRDSG